MHACQNKRRMPSLYQALDDLLARLIFPSRFLNQIKVGKK
jgi:hypothetical protein